MQKMTSAYANKMLKSLEEDKVYWVNKEEASSTYVAANGEEPVVPEYDYLQVTNTINEILIKKEYESVSKVIMEMQMALDRYNQTVQFEVTM